MEWALSAVVTWVDKFLLETSSRCTLNTVPSSTNPAMASIAKTGEQGNLTELWTNSSPVYEELRSEGKLVELGHILADGGVEAWWIHAHLVEAHPESKTLDGILANPQLVGGHFHDCPAGWACDLVNPNNDKAVDIAGHGIDRFQQGSGVTLAITIAAAYAANEP